MKKRSIQFHFINTIRQTLDEILLKGFHADRMIDKYVRANKNWSVDDRALFAESVYEVLRNKKRLEYSSGHDDLLLIIAAYLLMKGHKLPPRPEFKLINSAEVLKRYSAPPSPDIAYSIPNWLNEIGENDFKNDWSQIAESLCRAPKLYIRVNNLKINKSDLIKTLKNEGYAPIEPKLNLNHIADALLIESSKNLFSSEAYKAGYFEIQDVGSQTIAPLLQLQPGMCVVDACAGSGGKTLHIASLMQNRGEITAMDIQEYKLKDLMLRAEKAGCRIIKTKYISAPQVIQKLSNTADRLLLDVPCTGLGVLKRNPDSKWKLTLQSLDEMILTQRKILTQYSTMCKSGGLMVYATCSLLKKENEDQVKWFLDEQVGRSWQLLSEHRVWPHKHQSDGFYAAVLKKK